MAEHFRDFRDENIDWPAHTILEPEPDLVHRTLVKHGAAIMEGLGGRLIASDFEAQHWEFTDSDGSALMAIREPDIVIPAVLRHRDVGLFYTYTADSEPLWTPKPKSTSVTLEVDSGNPTPDSLVILAGALYRKSKVPRNIGRLASSVLAPIRDPLARRRWSVSKDRTKEEISAHYDLTQEVYTGENGFLDERFVQYSSGLLSPGRDFESLEDLQEEKVESLARKLELDSADTLLEVGGGWGGLAVALAQRAPNLHITSLTVSDEQLKRAQQRATDGGVADRVKFVGKDYRDLEIDEPFDRVVSVEMIEAVDWRDLDTYFDSLVDFVNPDTGVVVIQSINIKPNDYAKQRHNKSFSNVAIFPGGSLIPKHVINDSMDQRGWRTHEETELGPSYALTLREWIRNLYEHKPTLTKKWQSEGVDIEVIERFYRGFSFYLAFSQAGFRRETDHLEDWQLTFRPKA